MNEDFAAMLDEQLGAEDDGFEGRVLKGTVIAIDGDSVVVDVGLKSEGRVPVRNSAPLAANWTSSQATKSTCSSSATKIVTASSA